MTLDTFTQLVISAFGGVAIWLIAGRSERGRRWGIICGLLAQPAWYTQALIHGQYLMLPVYCLYTAGWLRGLWAHWIRP